MNHKEKNRLNFGGTFLALAIFLLLGLPTFANPPAQEETLSLKELINLPEKDLAHVDIATMNLAAAEGLPGSRKIDRVAVSKTIDHWANKVAIVTTNKAHFFKSHPDFYGGSWAKFCSIMLVLTLQQDLAFITTSSNVPTQA